MVLLSLLEEQHYAYYGGDQVEKEIPQQQENRALPAWPTDPHSPQPTRASFPTNSLSSTNTTVNPTP